MRAIHLILLPGLDGTGYLFDPLISCLPKTIIPKVVAYPSDKALGYNQLLPLVLAQLPQAEPFVLLGESFGGPLALKVAAAQPPGLMALVLCATFASCPFPYLPRWLKLLVFPGLFSLFKGLARVNPFFDSALNMEICRSLATVDNRVLAARLKAVMQVDVSVALLGCTVPMLYLQADKDLVVPKWNLRYILTLRPDTRQVTIPSSHLLLQTQPKLAAEAIAGFVAELLPRLC